MVSKEPLQVVDAQHVFFLLKPLLEPLLHEIGGLRKELKPMVDDLHKASQKTFIDSWPTISQDVAYEVTYLGYKYLYLFATQTLTLLTNSGGSITAIANQWTNISLPRGTKITAQGVSDSSPAVVMVRATNELLALSSAGGGGNAVTIADGADTTQGSKGDAAVTNPASSATIVALLKGILTELEGAGSLTANQGGAWTVTANQGGTWTVQPGNTANTTAWLVTAQQNGSWTVTANQGGTWTVQPGNTANTTPWLMQDVAGTSGGSTPFHALSAASTNTTSVKASAGQVYGVCLSNTTASEVYFKLFDKASAPVIGTDAVKQTIGVPANATVIRAFPKGLAFANGIAFAATGGVADNDTTNLTANALVMDMDYR